MGKIKDLSNQEINGIKIISFNGIKNRSAHWNCICHCGNKFSARGSDLLNGHTKSCGCNQKKAAANMGKLNSHKIIDLTNQTFGQLQVLEDTGRRTKDRNVIWKCQCSCGNIVEISSHALRQGQISCGCNKSKRELKIAQLLMEANIPFETQKTFNDCYFESGQPAKFDFFVQNKYIIEYDGIQHYSERVGWNTSEQFQKIKERDAYKNQWCVEHNIPIIRIPYTKYNTLTIEDLLLADTE